MQIVGHSFVKRLKTFIASSADLSHSLNLPPGKFLVQYSGFPGAQVHDLRAKLDVISDFQPDLVIMLVGTNDLFHHSPSHTAAQITDLVDTLRFVLKVPEVVVCQTLNRGVPTTPSRYPVDVSEFAEKVSALNRTLDRTLKGFATLWRLKGFWSDEAHKAAISADGVHLSQIGNRKLFNNLRAIVVTFSKRRQAKSRDR